MPSCLLCLVAVAGRICSRSTQCVSRDVRAHRRHRLPPRLVPVGVLARAALPRGGHPHPRQRRHRRDERLAQPTGRRLGLVVVALDVAKGFVPAFWGVHSVSSLCGILAGAAAMAGHARPVFLRFEKGGKMVATAGGVVIAVAPLVAPVCAAIWIADVRALPLRLAGLDPGCDRRCRSRRTCSGTTPP